MPGQEPSDHNADIHSAEPHLRKRIDLVPILQVDGRIQQQIRDIRNESGVRQWMYTDHLISPEEHAEWLARLTTDRRQIVFVVLEDSQRPVGAISVSGIDHLHRRAEWAYYLTENARGGLGSVLEYHFIDRVFQHLEIEKLNCEVLEGNDAVVKLHQKFGFAVEGFRRSHILKHGQRRGVHLLGLTRQDWDHMRLELAQRYRQFFSRYDVHCHWTNTES